MKRNLVYPALITAAGLIIAWLEFLLVPPLGIPGVKLGLANIATLAALYILGARAAACVCVARVMLSGFLFGSLSAVIYAMAGGLSALLAMALLRRTGRFSIVGVSVVGACCHNMAQLGVAAVVTRTRGLMYYLPVLIFAAMLTGIMTALLARPLIQRINKRGI
jgi:heptaprenyl diphosphate synthase